MKKLTRIAVGCLVCLLPASAAISGGFDMKPGKWEFSNTVNMPMMGQPQTTTEVECITKEEVENPFAQMQDMGNCKVLHKKIHGNTMEFEFECNQQGSMMQGKGRMTASGKTASGSMEMSMQIPGMENMPNLPNMPAAGQPMKMTTTWKGKYLGPCN